MSDPNNPAALHVRIITPTGETEDVCSLASFVKNNEHDAEALYALAEALRNHQPPTDVRLPFARGLSATAHAWRNLGAGGIVGLVIEEGPAPELETRAPSGHMVGCTVGACAPRCPQPRPARSTDATS